MQDGTRYDYIRTPLELKSVARMHKRVRPKCKVKPGLSEFYYGQKWHWLTLLSQVTYTFERCWCKVFKNDARYIQNAK